MKKLFLNIILLSFITKYSFANEIFIVTTSPVIDVIVQDIVKDKVQTNCIFCSHSDVHDMKMKPSEIENILNSDLFIYFNNPLLKKIAPKTKMPFLLDKYFEDEHELFVPKNAVKFAELIIPELCEVDVKNCGFYKENLKDFTKKLQELDIDLLAAFQNNIKLKAIIGHNYISQFTIYYLVSKFFEIDFDHDNFSSQRLIQLLKHNNEFYQCALYNKEDQEQMMQIADKLKLKPVEIKGENELFQNNYQKGDKYVIILKEIKQSLVKCFNGK